MGLYSRDRFVDVIALFGIIRPQYHFNMTPPPTPFLWKINRGDKNKLNVIARDNINKYN